MKLLSDHQSQILELLKERSPLAVDEIVRALGFAKTAVRRQLLSLEKRGLLQREFLSAERGRPSLAFRLTSDAKRLFPTKEGELLNDLMNFLMREGHESVLENFFDSYWQKRLDEIHSRIRKAGRDDLDTRMEALRDVLENEGFAPSARFEKKEREILLRECHCPIEAAVGPNQLPCRLEQRLIAKVLNAPLGAMGGRRGGREAENAIRLPRSKREPR